MVIPKFPPEEIGVKEVKNISIPPLIVVFSTPATQQNR